jgi:hypothetical protein
VIAPSASLARKIRILERRVPGLNQIIEKTLRTDDKKEGRQKTGQGAGNHPGDLKNQPGRRESREHGAQSDRKRGPSHGKKNAGFRTGVLLIRI